MGFGIGALGAAGRGFVEGIGDAQRMVRFQKDMERAAFEEEMRNRQRGEWKQQDQLEGELRGIDKTVHTEAPFDDSAFKFDENDTLPGKNVTRTDTGKPRKTADIYRDYANVLRKSGNASQVLQSVNLDNTATQLDTQELAARQEAVKRAVMKAGMLAENGRHIDAFKILQQTYDLVPDGRKLIEEDGKVGLADQSGKWIVQPQELSPENVMRMVGGALKYTNPEVWASFAKTDQGAQELGIKRDTLAANRDYQQGRLQNDATRNAAQAKYWEDMGKAALKSADARMKAAGAAGAAAGRLMLANQGQPTGLLPDGSPVFTGFAGGKFYHFDRSGNPVAPDAKVTPAPKAAGGGTIVQGGNVFGPDLSGNYRRIPLGDGDGLSATGIDLDSIFD